MADLSDNQARLMAAVRDAATVTGERPTLTTEQLGGVRDRGRNKIGADAARKAMSRLEARDLVEGEGAGKDRVWWLTDAGVASVDEARPATSEVESGDSRNRPYVVLEQLTVRDLLLRSMNEDEIAEADLETIILKVEDAGLYAVVGQPEARNTEHAFRQIAKDVYVGRGFSEDVMTVPSVAVDAKRWKVTPVNVKADPTVTIG